MLWSLFAIFYMTVALFGVAMTLYESLQGSNPAKPIMKTLGVLSCLVWPLILVVMAISARRPAQAKKLIQE